MDNTNNKQQDQEMEDYQIRQNKKFIVGKKIILFIAITNIIMSILTAILNFNIITLIIQITFSIILISGITWVRYLFVFGAVINIIFIFYILTGLNYEFFLPVWAIIILLIDLTYSIACSILLLFNECVSEYIYAKNSRSRL